MKEWSRLKKAAVISAVAVFGIASIGASGDQKNVNSTQAQPTSNQNTSPMVQAENTQVTQQAAQTTPITQQAPTPSTVSESKPLPAPVSTCDPNYAGACVAIASDVDCGGGSGNGPEYLYTTATVVGVDIYGLDRDGDGIACE